MDTKTHSVTVSVDVHGVLAIVAHIGYPMAQEDT